MSVYLLKDGTVIRTGYQSAGVPIYATGDVLTSPPVCGDGNATWQTMAVVTIDGGTATHVQSPVGGAYMQGACP